MNKKAIIEVAKSFGRAVWFGLLAVIATALTALTTNVDVLSATVQVLGQDIQVGALFVLVIGFVIKGIDRYIHKNKNIGINGIAPTPLQ